MENLERQSFYAYLPRYKKFKSTQSGPVPTFEPMFPRYIFFRPSKGQGIDTVRSTKGVSHVVRFGFDPATVGAKMVATIQAFEASQKQASLADMSNFMAGQRVKLKHVALGSMEGLVQGASSKGVAVLPEIFGRLTVVQVEHHQLEALN